MGFGVCFGLYRWLFSSQAGIPASAGTVMLSALPVILGMQLLLAFIGHDVRTVPTRLLHRKRILGAKERFQEREHAN
jgi:hypothetical protein